MALDYNAIEDYKFNPFTKTKYYTTITDESYVIPNSPIYGAYLIWLYHAPKETVPTSVSITIGGNPLLEVTSAPGNMQYRVFYDEEGCGCVEFNGNQAGDTALISYQHYGTFNSKAFTQALFDVFYGTSNIQGISMLNSAGDLDYDIDFGVGSVHNTVEKQRVLLSAMTKKLDSAWSIGNNGGMLDTGAIGANKDYYLYIIGKNTDPAAGDIVASLNPTTPALPASWTNYTLIGICQTDAASKIRQGQWRRSGNEIEFRYKLSIHDHIEVSPVANTNRILLSITAPKLCTSKLFCRFVPGGYYINWGETHESDVAPTGYTNSKFTGGVAFISEINLNIDVSKQIYFRGSNTAVFYDIWTLGWKIGL
jgi:hypothetical protein